MMLETTFKNIINVISQDLQKMGIKGIKYSEFQLTRDSRTSTTGGEGMSVFNEHKSHAEKYLEGRSRTFRLEFLEKASRMYRLANLLAAPAALDLPRAVLFPKVDQTVLSGSVLCLFALYV